LLRLAQSEHTVIVSRLNKDHFCTQLATIGVYVSAMAMFPKLHQPTTLYGAWFYDAELLSRIARAAVKRCGNQATSKT